MKSVKFDLTNVKDLEEMYKLIAGILDYDTASGRNYTSEIEIVQENNIVTVTFSSGYELPVLYECEFEENGTLQ